MRREGNVAPEIYEGLLMLQHRGQDSAGIVTTDWGKFREHKQNGLVKDVFDASVMETLTVSAATQFCGGRLVRGHICSHISPKFNEFGRLSSFTPHA